MSDDDDEIGKSRRTDPHTSREAGRNVPVGKLELMYLQALRGRTALATTEIANLYGMDRDSFSPRSRPLIRKGLIERFGTRPVANSSGKIRNMIAYRLKK